jgi:hypothetical protein
MERCRPSGPAATVEMKGHDVSTRTTDPLPLSKSEGMNLMAGCLSAERARGFLSVGLTMVQGHREGVSIRDLDDKDYIN